MNDSRPQPDRDATPRRGATPDRGGASEGSDGAPAGDAAGHPIDRRTLLKRGLAVGGALAAGGGAVAALTSAADEPAPATVARAVSRVVRSGAVRQPNILLIMVDQMRSPSWFPATAELDRLLPNLARLRRESVSFARHYTVSNDCTPARAALLTGLYTHQTGCLITGGSTLDPAFPTYGTMLREHGYQTNWYGKWHLTHGDHRWTAADTGVLEPYGFSGGTFPSPDGGPGQGLYVDPHVTGQFESWFAAQGHRGPWCTTVSLVNPHDIAWWYGWSGRTPAEASAPRRFARLPPNFETPELLVGRNKPRLQRSLQETAAASFGPVPFHGPGVAQAWLPFLDLYLKLQREVDRHIGRLLATLASRPEVAANTVVLFTSDHGEYGSSHGLRGKGAAAYEEAIRVPLMVKDPRGTLNHDVHRTRAQLSSSVDVAPLLLTIARGSGAWRRDASYAHLAGRPDLSSILADASAAGRPYVLHATDEIVTEYALSPYAAGAPLHITAVRTPTAKYATYSHWKPATTEPQAAGQERELYDYATHTGRLELHNGAGTSAREEALHGLLQRAIAHELREPLPAHLHPAQSRGYRDYEVVNAHAATAAALQRSRQQATQRPGLSPHGGTTGPGGPPHGPQPELQPYPPEALAPGRHRHAATAPRATRRRRHRGVRAR